MVTGNRPFNNFGYTSTHTTALGDLVRTVRDGNSEDNVAVTLDTMASNSPGGSLWERRRSKSCPRAKRQKLVHRKRRSSGYDSTIMFTIALVFLVALLPAVEAVFINFENCLDRRIVDSRTPRMLQFVPYHFDARFNNSDGRHNLNITVYGNVTGQGTTQELPPFGDPRWRDPEEQLGKIPDASVNYTTLFQRYDVLTFTPYEARPSRFCNSTINSTCPLGPSFDGNISDPYSLSAFTVAHDFY